MEDWRCGSDANWMLLCLCELRWGAVGMVSGEGAVPGDMGGEDVRFDEAGGVGDVILWREGEIGALLNCPMTIVG